MGLTTWKSGSVQKADVTVAKNYLHESEINDLNRIVTMWQDFAEDKARRWREAFLKDWDEKLDAFLKFNDRNVLDGAGRATKKSRPVPGSVRRRPRVASLRPCVPSVLPVGLAELFVLQRALPQIVGLHEPKILVIFW